MSRRGPKERAPASKYPAAHPTRVDQPDEASAADDTATFREAMRDVKPIKHVPHVPAIAHGGGAPRATHRAVEAHARRVTRGAVRRAAAAALEEPAPGTSDEDIVDGAEPLSFRRAGVRDQVMRKLRRGLFPTEDELDLHGLNQALARDVLAEFIAHQRDAGHRCVRIIHGKGYRSGARGPILKILVNGWLKRHLDVLAFCSAREIDGGTGAVYVLLRC